MGVQFKNGFKRTKRDDGERNPKKIKKEEEQEDWDREPACISYLEVLRLRFPQLYSYLD